MKEPLRLAVICLVVMGTLVGGGCTTVGRHTEIPPQVISQASPFYPFEMRRAGIEGKVLVEFIVDTEGIPREIRVLKSTHREFEAPAISAISKWRFKPATVDGKPVSCRMAVPVMFAIGTK